MRNAYSFIVSAAFLAVAATAQAADIPVKRAAPAAAVVPVAVAYSWTGFYVGAHAGGGWVENHWFDVTPPRPDRNEGSDTSSGWLGGGQIGYNLQAGALVYGIEAQGSFADITGSRRSAFFTSLRNHSENDFFCTLAGRIGFAQNNLLWFAKAGGAWTDSDFHIIVRPSGRTLSRWSQSRAGWMLGGGLEYGLTPEWSLKVEYDYIDFGSETTNAISCGAGCQFNEKIEQRAHLVMGGINYRFPLPR